MTRRERLRRQKASELGRRRAKARWALDRERRDRLAAMERERRRRLVVIVRDMEAGEERVFPWGDDVGARVRAYVERMSGM